MFEQAKIIYVMDGHAKVETVEGARVLSPGSSFALGSGRWCRIEPSPWVRMWTLYADELFLRAQMAWFLPHKSRVRNGLHPCEWDGSPVVLDPGIAVLRAIEPIWRKVSVIRNGDGSPEMAAVRTVELFARAAGAIVSVFVIPPAGSDEHGPTVTRPIINGHLSDKSVVGQIGHAARLLRARMSEPWTVTKVASEVALSRTHLTRLFALHTGVSPMRFLTEVRLTEFTRLIEETDFSVLRAANAVGWTDPRVASAWFSRRFGMTPSQYRGTPHPHLSDDVNRDRGDSSGRTG